MQTGDSFATKGIFVLAVQIYYTEKNCPSMPINATCDTAYIDKSVKARNLRGTAQPITRAMPEAALAVARSIIKISMIGH